MSNIVATINSLKEEASGTTYSVLRLYQEIYKQERQLVLLDGDAPELNRHIPFIKSFIYRKYPPKLERSPEMYHWLKQQARAHKIRLLHSHGLWRMVNIYPGWIAKKYAIPLIASPHGTLSPVAMQHGSKFKQLFWSLIQRPALHHSTCFRATSEAEYQDIRQLGFTQPIAIIPNGIDIIEHTPIISNSKFRTLLFLGRIHPIKGLDLLLPVWKTLQVQFPNWQLKIVGPDNNGYVAQLQKMAKGLNLQRVTFTGALFGLEKHQAYANADLFVLPSYSENFGMSVAEALAAGTPVITTTRTPWQILEQINAGMWVDANQNVLTEALTQLMEMSTNQLELMGARGKQLMIAEYSWHKIAKMMNELYAWVASDKNCPAFVRFD